MEQNDCVGSSGDVVIVVPTMDSLPEAIIRPDAHHICIDAEAEMEQQSPKTMTESSSEFESLSLPHLFMLWIDTDRNLNLPLNENILNGNRMGSHSLLSIHPKRGKSNVPVEMFTFYFDTLNFFSSMAPEMKTDFYERTAYGDDESSFCGVLWINSIVELFSDPMERLHSIRCCWLGTVIMLIELSYSGVCRGEVTIIETFTYLFSLLHSTAMPAQVGFVTRGAYHLMLMTVNVDV